VGSRKRVRMTLEPPPALADTRPFLELLERSGDYAADLGLTSQEIDPEKGVLLGNDPTASRSWLWSDGAVNIGRAEGLAP